MVCEVRAFLSEQYVADVSHDFVRSVADAVLEKVAAWPQRPLERTYAVIFFDELRVKISDEGLLRTKRSTWHWVYCWTEPEMSWAFELKQLKAPSLDEGPQRPENEGRRGRLDP